MAILKDYLGSLVKDLNEARYMADVESARIALLYANDPILKHFSVPRMKILDTELTIPIAIDSLEHSTITEYDPIDNQKLFTSIYSVLKNTTETDSFNSTMSKGLRTEIYREIDKLEKEIKDEKDTTTSIELFSNNVATIFINKIKNDTKEKKKFNKIINKISTEDDSIVSKERGFENLLKTNMRRELVQKIKPLVVIEKLENAHITTESAKLKEYDPRNIVYIKMKVTEESMEWQTMVDDEGNVVPKLMPE